ncbi:hypothetical protein BC834DRAFT_894864 [Gloeopeniophorella convolvens]|nr:hypothetical protein BC834DRAFT_894864 [Gloeopeniophorella convolvens]
MPNAQNAHSLGQRPLPVSVYTPCFPLLDFAPSRRRPLSSDSSSASTSGSQAPPKVSYSVRLSRSHLALAAVTDYIVRPPSPSAAAVNVKRVSHLRRKLRLAVKAALRDTSHGKWSHVYDMARLGSTRGKWQSFGSGRSTSQEQHRSREWFIADTEEEWFEWERKLAEEARLDAGTEGPYPRPPIPVSDLEEVRERIEVWQANVFSAPVSQADSQDSELDQPVGVDDFKRPSPLNFPVVKRPRIDVENAKKGRPVPSSRLHSTSRYFRNANNLDAPEDLVENNDSPAPGGSDAKTSSRQPTGVADDSSAVKRRPSPHDLSFPDKNIRELSEAFLPPSFPSHLQTSTPLQDSVVQSAPTRLTKPPVIPQSREQLFPPSFPSPPPFPHSQSAAGEQDPVVQGTEPISLALRFQITSENSVIPPGPSFVPDTPKSQLPPLVNVRRHEPEDITVPSTPENIPIVDLRELASSQRSRDRPRLPLHRVIPVVSHTQDKGKGRARPIDLSPAELQASSPVSGTSSSKSSLPHRPTTSLPLPDFTHDEHAFVPAAESTQKLPLGIAPRTRSDAYALGYSSQLEVEGNISHASGALIRDVDFKAWLRDTPVVDETDGVLSQASENPVEMEIVNE